MAEDDENAPQPPPVDKLMETEENEGKQMEDDSGSDEEDLDEDEQELMADSDVDNMEKLSVDFEALPPHESDLVGIVNLVTQIFLRTDIDCEGLAKKIIEQSPLGCVYKPTEECEDDDEGPEGLVYGVLSAVKLNGTENFQNAIADFLASKAKKHANKDVVQQLQALFVDFGKNDEPKASGSLGLIVNERMLHFPDQIAGPAFQSLSEDLMQLPEADRFQNILLIVKTRISDNDSNAASTASKAEPKNGIKKRKKKMGKAEKKRLAAAKLADADVIFDNAEEALLFQACDPIYFQYPVHSDVEKTSKFHSTIRNGTTYRPYRRVCLLTGEQFLKFADDVVKLHST